MKCTNCGKNEVSFYYTSNINGNVTKKALCAECAEKLGYTESAGSMFARSERMMSDMMDGFFGRALRPFTPLDLFAPEMFALPGWAEKKQEHECGCGGSCGCEDKPEEKANVDSELSRRREINALRHQMHMAARNEEYEKAAELRDRLKQLEG